MADAVEAINVSNLRTALSSVQTQPLLVKTPRTIGYHHVIGVSASSIITDQLYPDNTTGSDNWFIFTLEPLVSLGDAPGSFIGRPSTVLPQTAGVMLVSELIPLMTSMYNSYKVAVSDFNGIYLCAAPVRVSIVTEFGATNRSAAVLQLF